MATNLIKMQILLRRDTAANWELHKDIVPAAGEPCFVIDKNILKIGDGVTKFKDLEPINGVQLSADGKSLIVEDGVLKLNGFDKAEKGAQLVKGEDGTIQWIVPSTETVDGLKTTVGKLQTDVADLHGDVVDLIAIVGSPTEGSGTLLARVEGLEKEMDTLVTGLNDNGKVDTLMELIKYVEDHGEEAASMATAINTLQELVGTDPVIDQINAAIVGKVDKVDGMGLSSNDFTDSLLAKLEAIEGNAQVNIIEKVSIGGSMLDAVDKMVEIPVAGLEKAGVVKSATGANMVNVANDGTMSVKKVSVNSLFVPIGDELILDGGSAYKGAPVYSVRIGNMGCNSISDAVAAADNGDVIALQEDINMGTGDNDHLVSKAENVTIDLCGKELVANGSNGAVKVEGGMTTLEGTGAVKAALGSDKYSMAVWCAGENAKVVINNGTYCNSTDNSERGTDLIYASAGGNIEINGGTFIAAKPEWTLNVNDSDYASGSSNIIVRGGKFYKFNPADCSCEGEHTSFVADGYKSVQDGDYYIVVPV